MHAIARYCAFGIVFGASTLSAQTSTDTSTPDNPPSSTPEHRFYYGFRIEAFPMRLFDTSTRQSSTTQPIADYVYSASSSSQKLTPAATFEFMFKSRWSVGTEFYLTHAKYIQTTSVRTGVASPTATTDDRPVTTSVETTKANYWVLPVLARYQGLRKSGIGSRTYAIGGLEYRHVGRIRTGTDLSYPDGSTGYSEVSAVPLHREQIGLVVGFGIRYFDQLGFKLAPEVRFIRWDNDTFRGPGYASNKNQAEASLGFSF